MTLPPCFEFSPFQMSKFPICISRRLISFADGHLCTFLLAISPHTDSFCMPTKRFNTRITQRIRKEENNLPEQKITEPRERTHETWIIQFQFALTVAGWYNSRGLGGSMVLLFHRLISFLDCGFTLTPPPPTGIGAEKGMITLSSSSS